MRTLTWMTAAATVLFAFASQADAISLQKEQRPERDRAVRRVEVSAKRARHAKAERSSHKRASRSELRRGSTSGLFGQARSRPERRARAEKRGQRHASGEVRVAPRATARDAGRRERAVKSKPVRIARDPALWRRGPREARPADGLRSASKHRGKKAEVKRVRDPALWRRLPADARPADGLRSASKHRGKKGAIKHVRDPVMWRRVPARARREHGRSERVLREHWAYGGYGPHFYSPFGFWDWHWYHDPYWHGHSHVFVFRRGHGHLFGHHHYGFGHHHGLRLHHGFFHDFLFNHLGHVHFVILVVSEPVYGVVPVYEAPVGWVIEERDVPVLVQEGVPGAVYADDSCALLEIVTQQGSVLRIAVDPADFGAENVGQLRDVLEEALAATGELDVEDLAGVRHVIPRSEIKEIRGTVCQVE